MMLRKKIGIIAMIAVLCLALFAFAACSKDSGSGGNNGGGTPDSSTRDPNQLIEVTTFSIKITDTDSSFTVSWGAVPGAERYTVTVMDKTYNVDSPIIDFYGYDDFVFPTSDEITISIVAKAEGKIDSIAKVKTYKTEGVVLQNPEIKSGENGLITWQAVPGASAYILRVNDAVVSDRNDGLYHGTSYNVSQLTGNVSISVTAVGDGVWRKNSAIVSVLYNSASGSVAIAPISEYRLADGVLSWDAMPGVNRYRVVDVDYNICVVEEPEYDMTDRNMVYGVYPIANSSAMPEIVAADIKYLDGKGTEAEPYLIKTPFDLRAIDFYETLYAENGGDRNHYRIENDIDYNEVVALEEESNIYTLHKPFFGVLDGNNKKLSNIKVNYDGGYWSLFDFIATGATVKNVVLHKAEITNQTQDDKHPLNAAIAAIAYVNYGTVSGITLSEAKFSAKAGGVSGIVSRNYGTVSGCTVSGELCQLRTSELGSAAYEMAGVVLENCSGGIVANNTVTSLTIRGIGGNIGSAAGVVCINRAGGTVTKGTGTLGTLTVDGSPVSTEIGGANGRGKLVGKNEGRVS